MLQTTLLSDGRLFPELFDDLQSDDNAEPPPIPSSKNTNRNRFIFSRRGRKITAAPAKKRINIQRGGRVVGLEKLYEERGLRARPHSRQKRDISR